MDSAYQFTRCVMDCSKPTIAVIDGYCLAGAMELAQMCDIRYCSDDARFGAIEARFSHGLATMIMPWIVGNHCRELIYTGDMFDLANLGQKLTWAIRLRYEVVTSRSARFLFAPAQCM